MNLQPIYKVQFGDVVQAFKLIIHKLPKFLRYTFNLISKKNLEILRNLGKNKDLVICRPDKGNGTVLMDKADYIRKMNTILNDRSKFSNVHQQDIYKTNLKMEDKINYQLRKLKNNNSISDSEYQDLYVSGSSPPVMYGLPKVHKEGVPVRPILAAFKTSSYRLAKFLITFIQHLTKSEYTLDNS